MALALRRCHFFSVFELNFKNCFSVSFLYTLFYLFLSPTGNYMVVYGGYMHKHKKEEACYDNRIYLFHLRCHVWLSSELSPSQDSGKELFFLFFHFRH